jgi:hypothetical protein
VRDGTLTSSDRGLSSSRRLQALKEKRSAGADAMWVLIESIMSAGRAHRVQQGCSRSSFIAVRHCSTRGRALAALVAELLTSSTHQPHIIGGS